jgi:sulfotransferase famil protein
MLPLRSLITRTHNLFQGVPKENIFFLHLPKCAGTSISHAIKACYQTLDLKANSSLLSISAKASSDVVKMIDQTDYPHDITDDSPILAVREHLLLYFMSLDTTKYISGHFTFSDVAYREFHSKYAFITVLRDPVNRWISSYFFNRYKSNDHRKIEEDITTHLQSKFGQSQGYEYVKFIGGADRTGNYTSRSAIDRAKNNLHKFDIIGFLEHQDVFLKQFQHRFGKKLKIEKKNQNPVLKTQRESVISDEIKAKIKECCKPDCEVYQYALDKFLKTNHLCRK